MTRSQSAAREVLAIPESESSWECISVENTEAFIWTDDYTIERWNKIAAKGKLPSVKHRVEGAGRKGRHFLTYKQKTVEAPVSSDDALIVMHTLARLVRQDSGIRFCLDSWGSSDLAFLALPPAEWARLEKEFGKRAVACRFLGFPDKLADFFVKVEENSHEYADSSTEGDTSGTLRIVLRGRSRVTAGVLVLEGSSPLKDFTQRGGEIVMPESPASSRVGQALRERSGRRFSFSVSAVRGGGRALVATVDPEVAEDFIVQLQKSGLGTWRILRMPNERVLVSGKCELVKDE